MIFGGAVSFFEHPIDRKMNTIKLIEIIFEIFKN